MTIATNATVTVVKASGRRKLPYSVTVIHHGDQRPTEIEVARFMSAQDANPHAVKIADRIMEVSGYAAVDVVPLVEREVAEIE